MKICRSEGGKVIRRRNEEDVSRGRYSTKLAHLICPCEHSLGNMQSLREHPLYL